MREKLGPLRDKLARAEATLAEMPADLTTVLEYDVMTAMLAPRNFGSAAVASSI